MAGVEILEVQANYQHIMQLPKDKEVHDFIIAKFAEQSSEDRQEVLAKLLEMYRTSAGFNPLDLSKVRFKRIKSAAFKKVLRDIDEELELIISTQDYKQLVKSKVDYNALLKQYAEIKENIENGKLDLIEKPLEKLRKKLHEIEEYEMLLSLYKISTPYYKKYLPAAELELVINEYNRVSNLASLNQEHFITGLRTQQILQDAESGKCDTNEIMNLYDALCKLLIRQKSTKSKYETLIRIMKISEYLGNKRHYLEPYIEYTESHFEEIVTLLPESSKELNITLARFLNNKPLEERMEYLNNAIKESQKSGTADELALMKIIHAEMCCDEEKYEDALALLDDADYILKKHSISSFEKKQTIIRSALRRLAIYLYFELTQEGKVEKDVFKEIFKRVKAAGKNRNDIDYKMLELNGLLFFIEGKYEKAKSSFVKCARYRENSSDTISIYINHFFQELLRKSHDESSLKDKIQNLLNLNEPFYSTLWVKVLELAGKRISENSREE